MLKYLTGYDCVDSGSSPEGSELSDSSNDSRRNAENGGDGSSQILYLSVARPHNRTGTLNFIEQYPSQTQSRLDIDALKRVLGSIKIKPDEYCVVNCCGHLTLHVLSDVDRTLFISVCKDSFPINGAHFCLQEAKSKFSARQGQSFRSLKKKSLRDELQALRVLYENPDTLEALVVSSNNIVSREVDASTIGGEILLDESSLHSVNIDLSTHSTGLDTFNTKVRASLFERHLRLGKRRMKMNKIKMRLLLAACSLSLLAVLIYVFLRWRKYNHEHH